MQDPVRGKWARETGRCQNALLLGCPGQDLHDFLLLKNELEDITPAQLKTMGNLVEENLK